MPSPRSSKRASAPTFRLGKKPPRVDARTLRLAKYLTPALPPPPPYVTLYERLTPADLPMDGNDEYGDCTMAGEAHAIGAWTGEATGEPVVIPAATVTADYFGLTGGQDTGLDLLTVLQWARKTGFADASGTAHPIAAYLQVDQTKQSEIQQTVYNFGVAYIGLALPDYAVNPPDGNLLDVSWTAVPPGGFAANPPDPNNGHCVLIVGYDADNVYISTWGTVKAASWAWIRTYMDEAYAQVSTDWLDLGKSPEGLDWAQLQQDLGAVTGAPAAPAPAPAASPCPALLEAAEASFTGGHIVDGIEGLVKYVECVAKGGAAASSSQHAEFLERIRRRI